jgi:hypothetical protein
MGEAGETPGGQAEVAVSRSARTNLRVASTSWSSSTLELGAAPLLGRELAAGMISVKMAQRHLRDARRPSEKFATTVTPVLHRRGSPPSAP